MSEIHAANDTQAVAKLCPQCGSPSLQQPKSVHYLVALDGGVKDGPDPDSYCNGCGWKGRHGDLVSMPFKHELGSDDNVAVVLMNDMRSIFAANLANPLGAFLMKWGFLSMPLKSSELARYLSAAARAVLTALIEERAKIEKEKIDG